MSSPQPRVSLVLPTRERAQYVGHAVRACARTPIESVEILVLDNASTDGTADVIGEIQDSRVRYVRSERRLSMRDNFERGIEEARGDVICMLGDDDAILPSAVGKVLELMEKQGVAAVSADRAFYAWPDLANNRRNNALVPRAKGFEVRESRFQLAHVLDHADYYRLPILYHGFVARGPIDRIRARQGRFFLSNNPDIYSAIALSMENLRYAFCHSPLVVNGASARSNGAAHFGGAPEKEKQLWKQEDELGFITGFAEMVLVDVAIVEAAIRYAKAAGCSLDDIFDRESLVQCLGREVQARRLHNRPEGIASMIEASGVSEAEAEQGHWNPGTRIAKLLRSFRRFYPVDMKRRGVCDVDGAAQCIDKLITKSATGYLDHPLAQVLAAAQFARQV